MILLHVKLNSVTQLRPLEQKSTSAGPVCMESKTAMAMTVSKLGSVLQLHRICFADTNFGRDVLLLFSY
jgi:hypothetical protein